MIGLSLHCLQECCWEISVWPGKDDEVEQGGSIAAAAAAERHYQPLALPARHGEIPDLSLTFLGSAVTVVPLLPSLHLPQRNSSTILVLSPCADAEFHKRGAGMHRLASVHLYFPQGTDT